MQAFPISNGMKIRKGDNVKIISGKDRGRTGKVTHLFPAENKLVVEGINIHKKHSRPKKQGQKGQIIQMPMPVNVSNVMIICPNCGKPARIGAKIIENKKFRACKKCGAEIQ